MSERSVAVEAWEALYRAQVAVLRQLRAEFPDGETSLTEYDVLFNLSREPGHALRIRDLNKHLLLTQPSVSRLLDRLAARGLVTKSGDPDDARGTVVSLTEAGLREFRRVGTRHSHSIARKMAALTADELHELTRITDKLRAGAPPSSPGRD
ncbi:MarR family winged helix-turn-helix transcriptional regulator [Lysinimonas soli]|uniref:MarR family winged helix-turn-helix transcriptional regulator n=1 Tax=Lysinimonas soli TaxID=1074233 RepID=A0ABW0NTD9_9MICO